MKKSLLHAAFWNSTLTAAAIAGPLTPAAGPVTSTMKTLTEVEPRIAINAANTPGDADSVFRITQPGSYYLTGNVTVPGERHGIEIATSNVTIDLAGYRIAGVSPTSLTGITTQDSPHGAITIRNGVVYNLAATGIRIGGAAVGSRSPSGRIENVICRGNGWGLLVGDGFTLSGVIVEDNNNYGLTVYDGCTIENCIAQFNGGAGFVAGGSASFTGCTAKSNGAGGFTPSVRASFANCTADLNTGDGFSISSSSTLTNCVAAGNTDDGFTATGAMLRDCTSQSNGGDGFQLSSGCMLSNSLSRLNTGAGLRLSSGSNRIDSNHIVSNTAAGIDFANSTQNFVMRNTFTGHAAGTVLLNYVASNMYGQAGTPWENFTFNAP